MNASRPHVIHALQLRDAILCETVLAQVHLRALVPRPLPFFQKCGVHHIKECGCVALVVQGHPSFEQDLGVSVLNVILLIFFAHPEA